MGDQAQPGTRSSDRTGVRERTFHDRSSHDRPSCEINSGGVRRKLRWRDDLAEVVEAEIIPRLMLAHRGERPVRRLSSRPCAADDIVRLGTLLLLPEDRDVLAEVRRLLDEGMSLEEVLTGLLAPTARHIGRLWEEDVCDFVQVTTAMARLRRLVHDLETHCLDPRPVDPASRRVLLAPAPGETHTFGLTLTAHFLGETGWDVATSFEPCLTDAIERLRAEWFDVLGLSLSCDVHVERLALAVPVLRRASRNRDLRVVVGGPAFAGRPDRIRLVGADAAVEDARQAPGILQSLLDLRIRAC
ncbi:Methanogenic corrinoid protein MtbC1 [Methylobacterium sp. ap11]|uniref:cobalamin B12-binding domain-containing protein n=1 Tax=Methylobacterium sp. ap11 TaxID=1761799 RepID=UPI0008CDA7C1|nr:cobalamin B12-binding domain-containing protein [Methylobacterium sp. ap11]SEP08992.1 Methanogenic corrinoid protein MtbC1 [Methylobacterium sp. ap11]